jgi:hypothetical protein
VPWAGRAARRRAAALLILAGLPAPSRADILEPALWSRLERIEKAFRGGDAEALRTSLPAEARVRVDLRGVTDGPSSLGPAQVEVLFKGAFREQPTRRFSFRRETVKRSDPLTAFARVRWVRRHPQGGERVDALTFTLRAEDGDWRVHEILSSR